ncbi:hypothetical protein EZV62_022603 [Acer yangbiense]|uniref:Uncharacterized protein n=1 Tax=Acer yangbiense TaxID=1000413 RepID=A0A5C7H907_9ROSI|nr:hypothetical protein EZV62_022603 [Acer yangbiense]
MALNNGLRSASKLLNSPQSLVSKSDLIRACLVCGFVLMLDNRILTVSVWNLVNLRNGSSLVMSLFMAASFELVMDIIPRESNRVLLANHNRSKAVCDLYELLNRGFHSTGVKRMGGHGHDEPYYLHAKHMYNLDRMKHQKLKMSLGVFTAFSIGVAVPVYAVIFQQKKTASA